MLLPWRLRQAMLAVMLAEASMPPRATPSVVAVAALESLEGVRVLAAAAVAAPQTPGPAQARPVVVVPVLLLREMRLQRQLFQRLWFPCLRPSCQAS